MNKVLIIDDRKERKKLYLSQGTLKALEKLENCGNLEIRESIDNTEYLTRFSLIAVHRSYLVNSGTYKSILDFTKKANQHLIVFSGNISQNMIMDGGRQLNINASDFYVDRLPDFIERYDEEELEHPLLKFLYGESWKLSLLLQYRFLLWAYGGADEIDDAEDESMEERVRSILWHGQSVTLEEVNEEIEKEKSKYQHL